VVVNVYRVKLKKRKGKSRKGDKVVNRKERPVPRISAPGTGKGGAGNKIALAWLKNASPVLANKKGKRERKRERRTYS